MGKIHVSLMINNTDYSLEVEPSENLNFTLRERLGLTGTKKGCDTGGCGACTVIVDRKARYSCMTYTALLDGSSVETIEGVSKDRQLSRIQEAFVVHGGLQCGYCTPGFVLSTKAVLERNPHASEDEIKEALIGNICRCTGYVKILAAVKSLTESASRTEEERSTKR